MALPLGIQVRRLLVRVGDFVFGPDDLKFWDLARSTVQCEYARRHRPLPDWIDKLASVGVQREDGGVTVGMHVSRRRHLGPGESFPADHWNRLDVDMYPHVIHTDPDTGAITHRFPEEGEDVTLLRAFVNRKLEVRWEIDVDPTTLDPDELGWFPPEPP